MGFLAATVLDSRGLELKPKFGSTFCLLFIIVDVVVLLHSIIFSFTRSSIGFVALGWAATIVSATTVVWALPNSKLFSNLCRFCELQSIVAISAPSVE